MAYADANTSSRKLSAGVAVFALEAGLVWALITGLAYTKTLIKETKIGGIPIPAPTPTITPPPVPLPPEAKKWTPQPRQTLVPPQTGPSSDPTVPPVVGGGETGTATEPPAIVDPTPTPTPVPRATVQPKRAVPRGDTTRWLSTDDYPGRSIRERQEGRTGYRLTIDERGKVTGCTVTSSSGHEDLDRATCKLLPSRAKFEPARDETGAAVPGSFIGNVQWRLPPEE